ncbi:hypothetical protein [Pedobacter nutrimenti]|jgi:cbb3-type cytochrome oxidase subunit 3|uniref:Cbb3-type cytochrome oxidase component FixQ n=1 Tax=Pedobacter nutrimenti TaxID=1241337 RepID=A0A318U977_9SPHI|nr:hypothetical protein [Pedobacter nutrimenti]PYF68889.1 hypothetical protein B0O44_11167 [Pedobacter nutrimenti]
MFKQFLHQVDDKQVYLISSLGIFVLFFIIVGLVLWMMKKEEVKYMSELPLNEEEL